MLTAGIPLKQGSVYVLHDLPVLQRYEAEVDEVDEGPVAPRSLHRRQQVALHREIAHRQNGRCIEATTGGRDQALGLQTFVTRRGYRKRTNFCTRKKCTQHGTCSRHDTPKYILNTYMYTCLQSQRRRRIQRTRWHCRQSGQ